MGQILTFGDVYKSATQTLANKTLDKSVLLGVPAAEGAIGRDTTQLAASSYNNGMLGLEARVLVSGVGTQTFINDVATDQDYTSLMTFPANTIFANKVFRITLTFEFITGVSAVTITPYLKVGATKVVSINAFDQTNSVTRTFTAIYLMHGRAAAGAAANVSFGVGSAIWTNPNTFNTVGQPIALATNGTLTIQPGLTYSGTGSTESLELQAWCVEELY